MYNRRRLIVAIIIMNIIFGIIAGGLILQRFQTTSDDVVGPNPKFVIASWDYPDEYGQGIDAIKIWENSTGSWLGLDDYPTYYWYYDSYVFEWNASVAIKIRAWAWFNSTLTGAVDLDDGKNYFRHNVIVTDFSNTIVFSQQNFTYYGEDDFTNPPMWYYGYDVVLNFLPVGGEIYTATVTYEIYW